MKHNSHQFRYGLKGGVPIGLGYLAVPFTFGVMARGAGLITLQSVVMSFTNLTSAGQFAALGIIQAGAPFMEMAIVQLIINLCCRLMSCSLSQKLSVDMPFFHHLFMSYGVTDEILGVSVRRPGCLSPPYNYGLICVAVLGWTPGTLLGAVSGELLPTHLLSALSVALYGILLAVVAPPAKTSRILTGVIPASMTLNLVLAYVPFLASLSLGSKIILLIILVAGMAVIPFPVKEDNEHGS